ncbi:MAG: EAL domain-containing protein [Myxococcota bacterium]|jgi:diguanylate cyclase (GGDEF)-like protein|nr:EAL domain-containing protein [Myxococcota bacterium]
MSEAAPEPSSAPLVLVVDDDRLTRTQLRDQLEAQGFAVADASSGIEALAAFERLRPGLVLLDLHMPAPDGFAVCRELRARHPSDATPILVVTADDDPNSLDRAYSAGATDFVAKPLHAALLAHRIRYLMRGAHALVALGRSQRSLARAQRIARIGSWDWNPYTNELHWSGETFRILGVDPAEVSSWERFFATVHPADRDRVRDEMREGMRGNHSFRIHYRVVLPDGSVRHVDSQGEVTADGPEAGAWISGTLQDVTDQAHAQARIHYLASYDNLTGLANRRLFQDQLERAVAAARSRGHLLGVLFMDLDRFKKVNDTLGHAAGDQLLQTVSERLRAHVRGSDVIGRVDIDEPPAISRLGGDEFTVLLSKLEQPEDAGDVARRILRAIPEAVDLNGHSVSLSASIGIAIYPYDGEDVETLIKHADAAMYAAKEQGRDNFQFFSSRINASALRKLAIESKLRDALARNELRLHYQPRLDLRNGHVCAVEALIRWTHPELGVVSPREFIPLAEETGLIAPIGEWVMRTACAQGRLWQEQGLAPIPISVNVSPRQFAEADMRDVVGRILRETDFLPRYLELELTESLLLLDDDATAVVLRDLRAMGVAVALDDFGTGYSSLSYLARFPLDTLKMDRCFVRDVDHDPAAAGVAKAVIAIGHCLGARVVAEGVDTFEQERFLRDHGCDELQGFLLSGALPPGEVARFLAKRDHE